MSIDLPSNDSEFIDDEMEVAEKKPWGKKCKTHDNHNTKANRQPQAKKLCIQGKCGLLKQLVKMPVNILFEVL